MNDHFEDEKYFKLAEKWARGEISEEEMRQYADWYNKIEEDYRLEVPSGYAGSRKEHSEIILKRIKDQMAVNPAARPSRLRQNFYRLAIAASIVIFLGVGVYFYLQSRPVIQKGSVCQSIESASFDKHAGAILTMANGRQIALDTLQDGSVMQEGRTNATKGKGILSYHSADVEKTAKIAYNTMTTPRGKEYKLELPDGTKVWLNAASSITYPTAFNGNERIIQLKGEAYFEVFKDRAHPFKVETGAATIKVLGTHFDVMAYEEEKVIKTTLLEGAVAVSGQKKTVRIHPGQQATVDPKNQDIQVASVSTKQAVAWVNGKLSLDDLDVETLMRQVSRWYDVDVRFVGPVPEVRFWGVINRDASLSDILEVMKDNGVHVRQEGKTIIVSSK